MRRPLRGAAALSVVLAACADELPPILLQAFLSGALATLALFLAGAVLNELCRGTARHPGKKKAC